MFAIYTTAAETPATRDDGRAGKQATPAGPAYGFPDIVDRASGGAVNPAGWASEERRLPRGDDGPLCHLLAPWCPHRVVHTLLLAASGPCTARTCRLLHVAQALYRMS